MGYPGLGVGKTWRGLCTPIQNDRDVPRPTGYFWLIGVQPEPPIFLFLPSLEPEGPLSGDAGSQRTWAGFQCLGCETIEEL